MIACLQGKWSALARIERHERKGDGDTNSSAPETAAKMQRQYRSALEQSLSTLGASRRCWNATRDMS